jgi:hypothetical protein
LRSTQRKDGPPTHHLKQDMYQTGHGETIAIAHGVATCPVKAAKAWLQTASISKGPVFRPVAKGGRRGAERLTDQSVCSIVKAR